MPLPAATEALVGPKPEPSPGVQNLAPSSEVRFSVGDVPPPSPLYLTANDQIQVTLVDQVGGAIAYIDYQYLLPSGELHAGQENFNTLAVSGAGATGKNFRLAECFLLKVGVIYTGHTAYRGQVWVKIMVARPGSNPILLVNGYLTGVAQIAWPYSQNEAMVSGQGFYVTQFTAAPAAGTDFSFAFLNPYTRARLSSLNCQLTTSASVGPRLFMLYIFDGAGNNVGSVIASAVQPASTSWNYYVSSAGTSFGPVGTSMHVGLPPNYVIMPGWTIHTFTLGMFGTDTYGGATAHYEVWFDY